MTGFGAIFRKELREIAVTWRIWVCVGAFVVFGVIDPIMTRFMPEILASVVGDQVPIQLPPATYLDSWAQWTSDLSQLLAIVLIAVAAAAVAGEVSSGTLIMPLTKPISRAAFVLAKFLAIVALSAVSLVIGTALTTGVTVLIFDDVDPGPLWVAAAAWLVLAVLLVAITMLGSCLVSSTMAAFMIGFVGYILIAIVGLWQPARAFSPAGLTTVIGTLASGQDAAVVWPIATAFGAALLALVVAIGVFQRREL